MVEIKNFGGNVEFKPTHFYTPGDETQLLEILDRHQNGQIRVVASKHAWSDAIKTNDTLIDMSKFRSVEVHEHDGQYSVTVGAGCQIKGLLRELNSQGLTLPSLGLITEQTIAGATSTGTHGSGKHSLSHYPQSVRVACFPDDGKKAKIIEVSDGDELRAARCAMGCLGVVVSITLPCVRQYYVWEKATWCKEIESVIKLEDQSPIQQFYLFPYLWSFGVHQRKVVDQKRSWSAPFYRAYNLLGIDVGLHLFVKLCASVMRSRRLVHLLYRGVVPLLVFPWWKVVDRSDKQLVMEHELFKHLELEAFVPDIHVAEAARFVEVVLKQSDGSPVSVSESLRHRLQEAQLWDDFDRLRGTFTHHYPVCFRKVLRDDTLISMASGSYDAWYAISFITYVEPRDDFYRLATFLGRSMLRLFAGRIHWGKWFPLDQTEMEQMYSRLDDFRQVQRRFDPQGVFLNQFSRQIAGVSDNVPRELVEESRE